MQKLLTFDSKKNKTVLVGKIIGDTLFRDVNIKHYFRLLDGYGIQEPAFQELIDKKVIYIVEKVNETGESWKSTVKDWIIFGKLADYGHGKQRFLSLKYMHLMSDSPVSINTNVMERLASKFKEKYGK